MNKNKAVKNIVLLAAALAMLSADGCHRLKKEDTFYTLDVDARKLHTVEALQPETFTAEPNAPAVIPTLAEPNAVEPPAEMPVSLEEARAMALENNLELKASLIAPSIAEARLLVEEAKFEAVFVTRANLNRIDQPQQAFTRLPDNTVLPSVSGSQVGNTTVDFGVDVPLQTGGTLSFGLADDRTKQLEENTLFSPWYKDRFTVSLSQPLLRGAGQRVNLHSIRLARYETQIQDNATKLEVIRVLAAADRAYWRLYAARKELEVRKQQHDLAVAQLERAQRFVQAGQSAQVEIVRAEAGVARQLAAIITAENELRDRQREFKRTANKPGLDMASATVMLPETEPDPQQFAFDSPRVIDLAMENRAELLQLELQLAEDVSRIDFARNQALPAVNLDYTYSVNGVGPTRHEALDMLNDKNFESHFLGVSLWVPLGNDQRRNELRAALFTRRQRLAGRDSRRELIRQEVLNALDQVETNWQQILAGRQSAILQAQLYQTEIRQFEVGLRTSTDVLEAQTNFADAQSAEVAALTNYQISLVDLAYATGTLLGAAKVEWEPVVPDIGIAP